VAHLALQENSKSNECDARSNQEKYVPVQKLKNSENKLMGTSWISRQKGFAIANNLGGRLPKLTNILFVVQFFKQENVLLQVKFRVERIHMEKWSGFTSQVGLSKEVLNCCQVGYNLGWA
jgi:hypothetical protein